MVGIHPTAAALVQAAAPFSNSLLLAEQPGRKPQFTTSKTTPTAPSLSQGLPLTLPATSTAPTSGSYTEGGTSHGGVAFELSHASGNSWTFTPLYTFDQTKETVPPSSPLTIDAAGNLYGVTYFGGRYSNGSVFELSKTGKVWKETILHSFGDQATVRSPTGHRSSIPKQPLRHNFRRRIRGLGNCLRIVPPNLWSVEGKPALHFRERSQPPGWIDSDSAHNLYGTTIAGGAYGYGSFSALPRSSKTATWAGNTFSFTPSPTALTAEAQPRRSLRCRRKSLRHRQRRSKQLRGLLWLLAGLQTLRRFERVVENRRSFSDT